MASTKAHLKVTVAFIVLVGVFMAIFTPLVVLSWRNLAVFLLVIFWGVLVDVDHFPFRNLKAYLEGRLGYFEAKAGEKDFFHLWYGLAMCFISSCVVASALPLGSYVVHILVDGGSIDSNGEGYKKPHLPYYLWLIYPAWLKYQTDLGSMESIPLLYQKFMRFLWG